MKLKKYALLLNVLIFCSNFIYSKVPSTDKIYVHKALELADLPEHYTSVYTSMISLYNSKENWDKFRVVDPRIISNKFPGNIYKDQNVGVELTSIASGLYDAILKEETREGKKFKDKNTRASLEALVKTLKSLNYNESNPVYGQLELKESEEDSISFYTVFPEFKQWKNEFKDPTLFVERLKLSDFGNYTNEQIRDLKAKFENEFKSKIAMVVGDEDWHFFPIKLTFNVEGYEGGTRQMTPFGMQSFGQTPVTSFEKKLRVFRDQEKARMVKGQKEQEQSESLSSFQDEVLKMDGELVEIVLNDSNVLSFSSDVNSSFPRKASLSSVGGSFLLSARKSSSGVEVSFRALNDKFFMIDSSGKRKLQDSESKFIYFYDPEHKKSYLKAKDSGIVLDTNGYNMTSPRYNTGAKIRLSSLKEDQDKVLRSVFINDKFVSYPERYAYLSGTYSTALMNDDLFAKILLKIEESFSPGSGKIWSSSEVESLNYCLDVFWPERAYFVTDIKEKIFKFRRDVLAKETLFNTGTFNSNLEWAKIYLDGQDASLFEEIVEKMLGDQINGLIKLENEDKTGFEKLRSFLIDNQSQIKKITDVQVYQSWLDKLDGKESLGQGESLIQSQAENLKEYGDAKSLQKLAPINIQDAVNQLKQEATSSNKDIIQAAKQKIKILEENKNSLTKEQVEQINRVIQENSALNEVEIDVYIYKRLEKFKEYLSGKSEAGEIGLDLDEHLKVLKIAVGLEQHEGYSNVYIFDEEFYEKSFDLSSVAANNAAQEILDFVISPLGYLGRKQKELESWTEDDAKEFKEVLDFFENNFSKNKAVANKIESIKNMLSSVHWFSRELVSDLFEKLKQEYQAIAYNSEKKNEQEFISVLKKIYAQKVDARLTNGETVTESANENNLKNINAFLESVNYELLGSEELKTEFINLKEMLSQGLTLEEILKRVTQILKFKIGTYEISLLKACFDKLKTGYKRDISLVKKKQILALIEMYNSTVSTSDSSYDVVWIKSDLNPTFDTFLSGFGVVSGVKKEFDNNSDEQGIWNESEDEFIKYWNWLKRYAEWKPNLNSNQHKIPLKMLILRTKKSAESILQNNILLENPEKLKNIIAQADEELKKLA